MKPVDIKNFESICVELSNNNNVGVEYEFGDTKFTIPLMISGMDGKFTITDYKNLVKDISIY